MFADMASRRDGDDRHELPTLLKHVAYNYDFVTQACERLWRLGRDDARQLHQHPEHPVRILCELAAIEPGKPLMFSEAVIDFALQEARRSTASDHAYSVFEILEAGLKTEGHTTES